MVAFAFVCAAGMGGSALGCGWGYVLKKRRERERYFANSNS